MSSHKGKEIRSDRKSAMIGTVAGWAMRVLYATLRPEIRDHSGLLDTPDQAPVIYVLWHNRFFAATPAWQQRFANSRRCVALTSASHDGDMVARAMAVFGIKAVRGSSSRRGVAALVGLKRALSEGSDICLTPDGPRGPRYQVQAGAVKLAESSGAAVIPVHVTFGSAWRIRSWDRFVIPKPFSRVTVTFGAPVSVPRGLDDAAFESKRLEIESLLLAGADDVEP